MNKTVKLFAGLFVIGFFVFASLMRYGIIEFNTTPPPASFTTISLFWFRTAIGEMVASGESTIEEMLLSDSSDNLQYMLGGLFKKHGYHTAADKLAKHDGWGRPYEIEWRTNLFGVDTPMIHATDNELLIWSSGPNGINEYGGGDDLFDSCDWEIYKHIYKQRMEEIAGSSQSDE